MGMANRSGRVCVRPHPEPWPRCYIGRLRWPSRSGWRRGHWRCGTGTSFGVRVCLLRWIDEYGDCDGDGFVEYKQRSSKGLVQQGWKDSHDSVFHADGRMAEPPIALCEVQGYVYAAKRCASRIARALQEPDLAEKLDLEAEALRAKFEEAFW